MPLPLLFLLLTVILPIVHAYADSPSIKIGAILPLTGGAAAFGETFRNAMDLAVEDLPAADRQRVKVIFEDDGLVPSRSVSAARKLVDVDKVDAILTFSSSSALAVLGVTEARKIPQIAIASDPAVAVGLKYSFTYWALPEEEVRVLYEHLVAAGKKRVALVSVMHNGVFAIRDAFVKRAETDKALQVVADEEVMGDVTDFRSVLNRVKRQGPIDAFVPIFFPGQLAVSVRQAREVGITAPLFGFEVFDDKGEIKNAGGLFTGAVYATGADADGSFIKRFTERFPTVSTTYGASHGYDIVNLLVAATTTAKDGDTIAQFLRSLSNYPTRSGLITSTGDNRFNLPIELKTINAQGEIRPFGR